MTFLALAPLTVSVMFKYTVAMSEAAEFRTTLSGAVRTMEDAAGNLWMDSMTFCGQMVSPNRDR